uniref:COX17 oxidase n=1 Tax=Chrysemys picta bellii TaxID=8478 RepID=A0A8C3F3M3_CHRPI
CPGCSDSPSPPAAAAGPGPQIHLPSAWLEISLPCSIIEKGEEHCGPLIEAHKECMRALGFKV